MRIRRALKACAQGVRAQDLIITKFQQCGCVAFHMPKDAQMPICPISKRDCINEEIERVENNANKILSPDGNCRCLPACTNIEYKYSITSSSIQFSQDLDILPEYRKKMPSLNQDEFVRENVIGLHIYHKSLHFLTRNRGVVCVSNTFF